MSESECSRTVSSEQSEAQSSRDDQFPQRAGEPINVGRSDNGPISPHSAFSFNHDPSSPQVVTFESLINNNQTQRQSSSTADSTLMALVNGPQHGNSLSRRKSQFYGEVFAYREPNVSARTKIHQFSVITVEVKTNVIVSELGPATSKGFKLTARSLGKRRVYLPRRSLPTPFPAVPTTSFVDIRHLGSFRVSPLCRFLRLCLYLDSHRFAFSNSSNDK